MRRRGNIEDAEFARVLGGSEYAGRVGRVVAVETVGGTTWVVLELGGEEVTFEATEVRAIAEVAE